MSDPRYRAVLTRRATDEESVQIEVRGEDRTKIEEDINAFLGLLRAARIAHNEEVVLVFDKKMRELDAAIDEKGIQLRAIEAELAEKGHRAERRRAGNGNPAGAY